jgi:lysophospholipase L1-like esterase
MSILTTRSQAQPPSNPNPFEKDVLAFEAADRANPPPTEAILLAGDSQFACWKTLHEDLPGYTLINRGISDSHLSDFVHYADRIVIPYRPRLIVLHEGGNDIHAGESPERVLADLQEFVRLVRAALPATPIAFSSITPSPARFGEAPVRLRANKIIQDFTASQPNLLFIPLWDAYLGPDGKPREELFEPDHLHHSHAGYLARVRVTLPFLGPPK